MHSHPEKWLAYYQIHFVLIELENYSQFECILLYWFLRLVIAIYFGSLLGIQPHCMNRSIDIMVRVFTHGLENLVSILGRVIPTTQKLYLMLPCLTLSITSYRSMIKRAILGKELIPTLRLWFPSYWKWSLRFALNYGWPTYLYMSVQKLALNNLQWLVQQFYKWPFFFLFFFLSDWSS